MIPPGVLAELLENIHPHPLRLLYDIVQELEGDEDITPMAAHCKDCGLFVWLDGTETLRLRSVLVAFLDADGHIDEYLPEKAIPNEAYDSPPIYLEQPAVQVSEMRTVDAPAPAQELSNAETLQAPAPTPVKAKQSQAWTPEKRAAESERAKQRWADRRAAHGPPEQVAEDVPPPISAQVESATTEPAPTPPSEPLENVVQNIPRVFPPADTMEPLPSCQCPANWWASSAQANGAPHTPSEKHNHLCPLHRHKWRLPPAAGLDGQTHIGRCACGATKEHGFAPAVYGNAAQRAKGQHTAAVQA